MCAAFLRAEGVTKRFDGVLALDNVSVTLEPGTITALVGLNGSGKTTLLNILTGFLRPDEGQIYIEDERISGLPPWELEHRGIRRTFQEVRVIEKMTVLDHVLLGQADPGRIVKRWWSEPDTASMEAAVALLRDFGLTDLRDRQVLELSYGQRKLLSLATCLAGSTRALFLDEPVSGIFDRTVDVILTRLKVARADGLAILLIEHLLHVVEGIADTVVLLADGKVQGVGPAAAILPRARFPNG